ncbi:MAG: hypothetical protein HYS70_00180 [Nitrospinae bacterium]|nr:hypothetical protein [Nitrospinota bacterium]
MEYLFLFGAGASYGSDSQNTPPLGAGLFDELRRFNPDTWGTIGGALATEFRQDFEQAMKSVNPQALASLQRAMAAYFFQFAPRTSSLYFQLAQRIVASKGWSGAGCTLNYERLLEVSLLASGIRTFVGERAPGLSGVELCLPHGCCHLFCDAVQGTAAGVSFHGFGVQTDGPVTVIADPQKHRARILGDAFPPVMSYFEPAKQTTAGRSFIEGQRNRWAALATSAKTIVVVGVRVRPHDNHIWKPLSSTSARIVYCGGPSGSPEYLSWASAARAGRADRVLNGYFRDEFATICAEAGL